MSYFHFIGIFVNSTPLKVIYETDEAKTIKPKNQTLQSKGTNNATKIATDHFLVSITENGKDNVKAAVKDIKNSNDILALGEPLIRDEEVGEDKTIKGSVPDGVRDTLRGALVGVIIDKLKQGGDVKVKNSVSKDEPTYVIREDVAKKHQVTDMFVKFLEDLSKRLGVDVITVAEQLISRSSEKSEGMEMEMSTGYARDNIPSIPIKFKPIIRYISVVVQHELKSARLLG